MHTTASARGNGSHSRLDMGIWLNKIEKKRQLKKRKYHNGFSRRQCLVQWGQSMKRIKPGLASWLYQPPWGIFAQPFGPQIPQILNRHKDKVNVSCKKEVEESMLRPGRSFLWSKGSVLVLSLSSSCWSLPPAWTAHRPWKNKEWQGEAGVIAIFFWLFPGSKERSRQHFHVPCLWGWILLSLAVPGVAAGVGGLTLDHKSYAGTFSHACNEISRQALKLSKSGE